MKVCKYEIKKGSNNATMAKVTDEMFWLAQDIYCRHVAATLAPKDDVQQVAQTCSALASEFFAAHEATQGASQEAVRVSVLVADKPGSWEVVFKTERQKTPPV